MASSKALVLSVLCVAVLAAALSDTTLPVPFYAWSGSSLLQQNGQAHQVLARALERTEAVSMISSLLNGASKPEAVLIVTFAKMSAPALLAATGVYSSSASAPLASLQTILSSSASSVQGALNGEGSALELVLQSADQVSVQGTASQCDSFLTSLRARVSKASTDAVLLVADDLAATGSCIARASDIISQQTQGRYLALLSSDASSSVQMNFMQTPEAPILLQSNMRLMADTNSTLPGVVYISSTILYGLFFGFFFLLATCVGLCCLDSIQTPLRFPSRKMAVNKEY